MRSSHNCSHMPSTCLPLLVSLKPWPDCRITDTIFFLPRNKKCSDTFSCYPIRSAVMLWAPAWFCLTFSLDFDIFTLRFHWSELGTVATREAGKMGYGLQCDSHQCFSVEVFLLFGVGQFFSVLGCSMSCSPKVSSSSQSF